MLTISFKADGVYERGLLVSLLVFIVSTSGFEAPRTRSRGFGKVDTPKRNQQWILTMTLKNNNMHPTPRRQTLREVGEGQAGKSLRDEEDQRKDGLTR